MKIYRHINPFYTNDLHLICDTFQHISDIKINCEFDGRVRKNYIEFGINHCESKAEDLANYFFQDSKMYTSVISHQNSISECSLVPGRFYKRIYRPVLIQDRYSTSLSYFTVEKIIRTLNYEYNYIPHDEKTLVKSIQQLKTLVDKLSEVLLHVYPSPNNYAVYGHEIRNLLILSCTEVEAQLAGILKEHATLNNGGILKTNDYIKLKDLLKLDKYSVRFLHYPEITNIQPFLNWNEKQPTKSLDWYHNYNEVKHDREANFEKAKLKSVIDSICAIVILLHAQYGANMPHWNELMGAFFEIENEPTWELEEMYLPPFYNQEWEQAVFSL